MQYLADSHMVRDDRVIEGRLTETVLVHLWDVVLGHKSRVAVLESSDGGLKSAVRVGGAHAEALRKSCLMVSADLAFTECGLARTYAEKQRVYLLTLVLTEPYAEQVPVFVYLLVKRVLDLLHGHLMIYRAYLFGGGVCRSVPLAVIEWISHALGLYITGRVMSDIVCCRSIECRTAQQHHRRCYRAYSSSE